MKDEVESAWLQMDAKTDLGVETRWMHKQVELLDSRPT